MSGHVRGILIDPDCRDGKHRNCEGVGWNTITNAADQCPCSCHKGERS